MNLRIGANRARTGAVKMGFWGGFNYADHCTVGNVICGPPFDQKYLFELASIPQARACTLEREREREERERRETGGQTCTPGGTKGTEPGARMMSLAVTTSPVALFSTCVQHI